jgi:calcineurin-like phosphoesterase
VVTVLSAFVTTQIRPSPTEDAPALTQGPFVLAAVVQVTPAASRVAGQVVVVLGTHTHVPTADAAVLPGGTAYTTDVGMTGCEESSIGFDREDFLGLFLGERRRISVASRGPVVFNAVLMDFGVEIRRALRIEPVRRTWVP